jgi:hypothetical protein
MFRCCSAHFSGQRAHIVKGAARGLVVCASKRHAYTWHNTAKTPQHDRLKPVAQQAAELPASRAHGWIQPQTPPKRMHHTGLALGGGGTCGRRRVAVFGGVSGELRRRVRPSSDCTALPVPWWSPRGCTTPCAAVVTCGGQCQLHGAPSQADSTGLLVCTRRRAGRQTMQSLRGACSPPPTRCRRASTAPGGGGGAQRGSWCSASGAVRTSRLRGSHRLLLSWAIAVPALCGCHGGPRAAPLAASPGPPGAAPKPGPTLKVRSKQNCSPVGSAPSAAGPV